MREILENGFEADYASMLQNVYDEADTMSVEECVYVGDLLQMYDMMRTGLKNGQTKGIDPERLRFSGFDGNNETKFMAYARHMRIYGKWKSLDLSPNNFNSHSPTKGKYAKMLSQRNSAQDKHQITAADILRIVG